VALETQSGTCGNKKLRVLRRVGIVTVHATAVSGSFVHNGFRSGIIVAVDTQVWCRLQKESLVFRSMRVVATHTPFLFHSGMDVCPCGGFIVALITECIALFQQDQLVGITVVIVARFAIHLLER
jgi:hypothetical protein